MKPRVGGVLIASAVAAGIYAAASVTATTMARTIDTAEVARHSRFVAFETALKRASAEYRETRGKCDSPARAKRTLCNAGPRPDERRAFLQDTDYKDMTP